MAEVNSVMTSVKEGSRCHVSALQTVWFSRQTAKISPFDTPRLLQTIAAIA
jgi:hypothetical protein